MGIRDGRNVLGMTEGSMEGSTEGTIEGHSLGEPGMIFSAVGCSVTGTPKGTIVGTIAG